MVGGAEKQLYLWLEHMDRERFTPIVITLHPNHGDYWEKPIEDLGIRLYDIPQKWNRITRLQDIHRILKEFKPELIHGWQLFSGAYATIAAKRLGKKSLCGVRDTYKTFVRATYLSKFVKRFVDGFLVNSDSAAADLNSQLKGKKKSIFVVPNAILPIDTQRELIRESLSKIYNLPTDLLWMVSIGRMEMKKHFETILQLLAKQTLQDKPFHFILIGDGPERFTLEQTAQELGVLDHVTFTGEVPQASQWLPAFDLFVFTSIDEGMPNVILEAAAAGLPIVTWDLPFYQEILDNGKTGLLVEAGNVEKLEEAVTRLIESPQLRAQLGVEAQARILREFSLERYIRSMTAAYDELLNNPPAGASGNP